MRRVLALVLAVALSGCAAMNRITGSKPAPSRTGPAAAKTEANPDPAPKPKRSIRVVREEKPPERVASINPDKLIGLDPPAVEKLLGVPSARQQGEPSQVWTYSGSGCSLMIYFFPDLKTGTLHALKYDGVDRNGMPINISQECIRNILVVKTNVTG
jgi:hypothetical protein